MSVEIEIATEFKANASLWSSGPDEVMPAENFTTSRLDQPVKLRATEQDLQRIPPVTIYTVFKKIVDAKPNHDAMAFQMSKDAPWTKISYSEYWKMCTKAAKSFIKLGVNTSECVAIVGFNAPPWFISQLGAMFAGGVGCGMYTTNSAEQCELILTDCEAKVVVVENKQQLEKVLQSMKNSKCRVNKIVQYIGEPEDNHNGLVINWNQFMELGNEVSEDDLTARINSIAPNKCATLIYTSGTTGTPKAAMISHDSICYNSFFSIQMVSMRIFEERSVSYLPLSHIAGQMLDIYMAITVGGTVYFAQPDALKGSLVYTLRDVKPTCFLGVPRVWEKIHENIEKVFGGLSGAKLFMLNWARKIAHKHIIADNHGLLSPAFALAKTLVLNKLHKEIGLEKSRILVSGAAPINNETLEFFNSLGLPIMETFGMSESTGGITVGNPQNNRCGSTGLLNEYHSIKLIAKDADGFGEISINGRSVYMGYLNDENKTVESFNEEGWLRTGDLGKIDEGFLYITGRLKELIITAGGENIPPVQIETNLKNELPNLISNSMLIGDKRKFLSILITLKCQVDSGKFLPLDELTPDCINYLKSIGSNSTKVSEIVNNKDQIVYKAIENAVKNINKKAVSRAACVQKFLILPRDFSLGNGELGPTLKLRRPIVNQMYKSVIDGLYTDLNNNE